MERADALCAMVRANGSRVTAAKRSVLEALVDAPEHLTAEDVFERVQRTHPDVHRSTVYRILQSLSEQGITEHTHLGHGPAVYHLADDRHHHLVCDVCGAVIEVPPEVFGKLARTLADDYGFVMQPRHFAVVGRCRACA